jgi:hypothetical protein
VNRLLEDVLPARKQLRITDHTENARAAAHIRSSPEATA